MLIRYLAMVALTSLALSAVAAAAPRGVRCGTDLRERYSPRALRRMRTGLQFLLLQARRERIAAAQRVLEHHGSPDVLLQLPDDAAVLAQGAQALHLKHLSLNDATSCW